VVAGPSPLTSWTLQPFQLVPILLLGLLYARRVRTLAGRGQPVPAWRLWCFGLGLLLLAFAVATPLAAFAEQQFFSAHMLQHVILGDLAPLAILAGLTGPVLRPLLSFRAVNALRVLSHPFVALPIWAVNLYIWHLPLFYEGAVRHELVHALEHACFFTAGLIMWSPVLEVLPGPAWFGTGAKLAYVVVVRLVETVLANIFLWSGNAFYDVYRHPAERWGISAAADQGIAGAVMMIEGSLVTLIALGWLFLRLAKEGELRQQLIERGLDPATVSRAVRYGRGEELVSRQ
jgi:cytochrome c oxidase assembly factor CtaG